jgi:hypothetical protein
VAVSVLLAAPPAEDRAGFGELGIDLGADLGGDVMISGILAELCTLAGLPLPSIDER